MRYSNILRRTHPNMNDQTPQTVALPGMVPNNAGGHYYEVDDWQKLDRFLILGSDAGTYYVTTQDLTKANVDAVQRCIDFDGLRAVKRIVEISTTGRAPKNDSALLALALACAAKSDETRREALASINQVARTGTHLLMFVDFVKRFRGFGRGLRKALGRWFTDMPSEKLALQAIKYNQRNGWALRDVLRLAHPKVGSTADWSGLKLQYENPVIRWILKGEDGLKEGYFESLPLILRSAINMKGNEKIETSDGFVASDSWKLEYRRALIQQAKLPREAVPTELLNNKKIWSALLQDMPMTAMIRNLGKMTSVGLFDLLFNDEVDMICDRLKDAEKLNRARIHPMQILLSMKTYEQGHGDKGKLTWQPNQRIVAALNEAFPLCFPQIRSTGKRILVSVDTSGSMTTKCSGSSEMSAWQAGAAMALMLSCVERNIQITSFDTNLYDLNLHGRRLDDVLKMRPNGGGTDTSMPIRYALEKKIVFDAIVIFTDSETWAGNMHAVQALHQYRKTVNPDVKVVCAALAANNGSIVDPKDPLSFGICGLDASVPQLISDFIKGD